ncbi:hypothetical protein WJX79_002426 [Trebouxia sp. C0005]|nr:MAG: E3 ubiquitin- ligase ARI7 [Trebouxia sp. A1-2]
MDYDSYDSASEIGYSEVSSDNGDFGFDGGSDEQPRARQAEYVVLSEQQLKERKHELTETTQAVLNLDEGGAAHVLRHCSWDPNRAQEEWFGNANSLQEKTGLFEHQPPLTNHQVTCQICFDSFPVDQMHASGCNHYFCTGCWEGYVAAAISEGPASLNLRCPLPDCKAAVPRTVVRRVSSEQDKQKLELYELRSYVEDSQRLVWCPAPNCEHAVECVKDLGADEPLDVLCKCGSSFCFSCQEEAHRPVDCQTVGMWLRKNSAESENANWILANTKPCPKCKRPIEKNQGCMHMVCSQCRSEFCWLCLGNWADHGERTGGYYSCNRYETAKKKGDYDEETQKRENAKQALERYMHYYQRWAENDKARLQALSTLDKVINDKLEDLSEITATPTSQLKFVTDAWAQVVDCRRMLKWTYAFGYYRFADQTAASKPQQEFFEFNQGQAEYYLEKLHGEVEKQLDLFLKNQKTGPEWRKFRETLIGLTDVTHSHFAKLVQELEKGVDTLLEQYKGMEEQQEEEVQSAPLAAVPARSTKRNRQTLRGANGTASSQEASEAELEAIAGYWQCRHCTSANRDFGSTACEVCGNAKQATA